MKLRLVLLLIIFSRTLSAQIGGGSVYEFLNLNSSARVASLGGQNISLTVQDPSFIYFNPALLNDSLDNCIALNFTDYYAGINYGYASFSKHIEKYGDFALGLHYINYGKFIRADETGTENGNFYASDYAFNLSYSKALNTHFRAGVNLKPILSFYDSYSSIGLVADAGLHYNNDKHLLQGGLVIRNAGLQITSYTGEYSEKVRPEILLGITKKLPYAPFRFSLTYRHLEKWDLTYDLPEENGVWQNAFDTVPAKTKNLEIFGDKLLRHLVIGTELLLTQNFYISMGYNYQRRQELKISTRPSMVGLSWGLGIRIAKFNISYGRASYHLAGATNHFSITTNLNRFYKKAE